MGQIAECCNSIAQPEVQAPIRVFGDYFNADTRTILTVLMYCRIEPKLTIVNTLQIADEERKSFKINENPSDCYPMLLHGKFKIISNIESILNYLQNAFP